MLRNNRTFYYFSALIILYVAVALLLPPSKAILHKYHLSLLSARVLTITVIAPVIAIYFIAFYGFFCLNKYAEHIKKTKDGEPTRYIAHGLMILVFTSPAVSIITSVSNFYIQRNHLVTPLTILNNYISLIPFLVAFGFFSVGARRLVRLAKQQLPLRIMHVFTAVVSLLGVTFTYIVVRSALNKPLNIYRMPVWVVLFTLVAPYIYMWCVGLLAAVEIYLYHQKVSGILYRQSWRWLSIGLITILGVSVVSQFIVATTSRINRFSLSGIFVILFLLLFLLAAGYGMVARGASSLNKIEEV